MVGVYRPDYPTTIIGKECEKGEAVVPVIYRLEGADRKGVMGDYEMYGVGGGEDGHDLGAMKSFL